MNKLFTIIRREYLERVRNKMFILATALAPVLMVALVVVPALLAGIKMGDATRIAIVDETNRMAERVRLSLVGSSAEDAGASSAAAVDQGERDSSASSSPPVGPASTRYEIEIIAHNAERSTEETTRELAERVRRGELDAYLVIPPDVFAGGRAEYYGRNVGDVVSISLVRDRISRAVTEQRLIDEKIDERRVRELSQAVPLSTFKVSEKGQERDSGAGFILAYVAGGFIYFTMLVYCGMMLSAVVEEKATRISEMLLSSEQSFPLMLGKLIGISLVALTQYTVWLTAFVLLSVYGVTALAGAGSAFALPSIGVSVFVYFLLFFLLGYFVYATLYLLVGTMVTNTQEGQQLAMPLIMVLVIAFSLSFPVIRSPDSSFAFWLSMIPLFAPITMLVRIMTETPPLWQIALSLAIGFATVVGLVWVAARTYRVGMLMYGKRASLPEVWRWVRSA
ncbi:MAG: ABC transporter permease [Pyrinomonadaceae bacterium]